MTEATRIADYYATYHAHAEPALVLADVFGAVRNALEQAGSFPLTDRRIYDVGCGSGGWLARYLEWGAQPHRLTGVDLAPNRIEAARETLPGVTLHVGDAAESGLPDQSQDIVSTFTVFSAILDRDVTRRLAAEMIRVKKPDGVVLWYEMRVGNPANPEVRGIGAQEIRSLFPGCAVQLTSTRLLPQLGRMIAPRSPTLYRLLNALPFLRTHYLGVIR